MILFRKKIFRADNNSINVRKQMKKCAAASYYYHQVPATTVATVVVLVPGTSRLVQKKTVRNNYEQSRVSSSKKAL